MASTLTAMWPKVDVGATQPKKVPNANKLDKAFLVVGLGLNEARGC
jgi:hypothetical protein